MLANLAMIILFSIELSDAVSNFYTQSFGFLVATIAVCGLMFLTELGMIITDILFVRDLCAARATSMATNLQDVNPLTTSSATQRNPENKKKTRRQ